jgi:hypothetical protein
MTQNSAPSVMMHNGIRRSAMTATTFASAMLGLSGAMLAPSAAQAQEGYDVKVFRRSFERVRLGNRRRVEAVGPFRLGGFLPRREP